MHARLLGSTMPRVIQKAFRPRSIQVRLISFRSATPSVCSIPRMQRSRTQGQVRAFPRHADASSIAPSEKAKITGEPHQLSSLTLRILRG